jgi:hypothetical protein
MKTKLIKSEQLKSLSHLVPHITTYTDLARCHELVNVFLNTVIDELVADFDGMRALFIRHSGAFGYKSSRIAMQLMVS